MKEVSVQKPATQVSDQVEIIEVDYSMTFEDMIAVGHYNDVHKLITPKHFLIQKSGLVRYEKTFFKFNQDVLLDEAVGGILSFDMENPWQPAGIESLLVQGALHPDDQRTFSILALGSGLEIAGRMGVPCLTGDDTARFLEFYRADIEFLAYFLYLAVRPLR